MRIPFENGENKKEKESAAAVERREDRRLKIASAFTACLFILGTAIGGTYIAADMARINDERLDAQGNSWTQGYVQNSANPNIVSSLSQISSNGNGNNDSIVANPDGKLREDVFEEWKDDGVVYPISGAASPEQGSVEIIASEDDSIADDADANAAANAEQQAQVSSADADNTTSNISEDTNSPANDDASKKQENPVPIPTGELISVKYLMVDDCDEMRSARITDIWKDDALTSKVLGQQPAKAEIYALSTLPDYYVVYATPTVQNGIGGQIVDALAALDDANGQAVDGVVYDSATGLAYIPASAIENDRLQRMQLQFLQLVDLFDDEQTMADIDVTISSAMESLEGKLVKSQSVKADAFDSCIEIPLFVDDGKMNVPSLEVRNFDVYFGGVPVKVDDETAMYDRERGVLVLGYAPNGVSSISIRVHDADEGGLLALVDRLMGTEEADAAYVISEGNIAYFYNGNTFFDRISTSQLKQGASYVYSARMRPYGIGLEGSKYGVATGENDWYRTYKDANEQFAQRIKDGASWNTIRSSTESWHTIYNSGHQVMESEGPFNKVFGGLDWHVIGDYTPLGLECSHINSAVGYDPHWWGEYFQGNCFMRILRVVNSGNWSYVIFGLQTPNSNHVIDGHKDFAQAGSGLYKVRIASSTTINIVKTSTGSSAQGITAGTPVAGARYGVYKDQACTQLLSTATTNSSGRCAIYAFPDVDCYVRELSAPWPYSVDNAVHRVRGTYGQKINLNVKDGVGAILQVNKLKRPQNGEYEIVSSPIGDDAKGTIHGKATISGANDSLGYEIDIDTNATFDREADSIHFEVPMEVTYGNDARISMVGNAASESSAVVTFNARELSVSGLEANASYKLTFTGKIQQGWNSNARSAQLLVVNSRASGDSKSSLTVYLPESKMQGAQYTIYADEACTIEAGDYNVVSAMQTPIESFHMTGALTQTTPYITSSYDFPAYYNWWTAGIDNGTAILVNTSSNFALSRNSNNSVSLSFPKTNAAEQGWTFSVDHGNKRVHVPNSGLILTRTTEYFRGPLEVRSPNSSSEEYAYTYPYDNWQFQRTSAAPTLTINAYGSAKWGNASGQRLEPGYKYYVKETKAPDGYDLDPTVYSFTAESGGVHTLNVTDTYTSLELRKKTLYPEYSDNDDRYSLEGAEYGLYYKNPDTDASAYPVKTLVTDVDGKAHVDHLIQDHTYYVKELKPSKGMMLDKKTYELVAKRGTLNVLNVIEDMPVKLSINKVSQSAVPNVPAYSLAGGVFDVYASETDARNKANAVASVTSDENGKCETLTLPMRDYWIREVTPPYGYHPNDDIQCVTHENFFENTSQSRTFMDVPRNVSIQMKKVTDPLTTDEEYFSSLAGAEFVVYGTYEDALLQQNGIATVVTAADGTCPAFSLPPKEYYFVREKTPPDRYYVNDDVFTMRVTDSLDLSQDLYDEGWAVSIDIEKQSSDPSVLSSNYSLKGATLGVYESELDALNRTNPVSVVTTDENGKCPRVEGLHPRTYWVSEITPPTGFYLTADPVQVHYKTSVEAHVMFKDDPHYGYLLASKRSTDEYATPDTNSEMFSYAGTKFAIYDSKEKADAAPYGKEGDCLFTMTTDATGDVQSTIPLVPGTYYMREVVAPKGYQLSPATYVIETFEEDDRDTEVDGKLGGNVSLASVNVDGDVGTETPDMGGLDHVVVLDDGFAGDNASEMRTNMKTAPILNMSTKDAQVPTGADLVAGAQQRSEIFTKIWDFEELAASDASEPTTNAVPAELAIPRPFHFDYTLHYDLNGGSGNADDFADLTMGYDSEEEDVASLTPAIPEKDGHVFKGWITRVPEMCGYSPLYLSPGESFRDMLVDTDQHEDERNGMYQDLRSFADADLNIELVAVWEDAVTGDIDTDEIDMGKVSLTANSGTTPAYIQFNGWQGNVYSGARGGAVSGWSTYHVGYFPTSSNTALYCAYNPYNGDYLITTWNEYNSVTKGGWQGWGLRCYAADGGGYPLYRFYNMANSGKHLWRERSDYNGYTANESISYYMLGFYNISFAGNGATSGSTASMNQCLWGNSYALNNNGFARTGYKFAYWKCNNGYTYSNKQSVSNLGKSGWPGSAPTYTMTAQWTPNTYNVAFNGNGATSGSIAQKNSIKYDANITLPSTGFNKLGYRLSGWNTRADGKGTHYNLGQVTKNLTASDTATVTLYAEWAARPYTIKFDSVGGTGTMNDVKPLVELDYKLPNCAFTKPNCEFVGWALTRPYGDVRIIKARFANGATVKDLGTEGSTVTLYAVWKARIDVNEKATTVYNAPLKTTLQIRKKASGGYLPTADAAAYSFAGAKFGVYSTRAQAEAATPGQQGSPLAIIETDAQGIGYYDNVQVGTTYYLKELSAPASGAYELRNDVIDTGIIKNGAPTTVEIEEPVSFPPPDEPNVELGKVIADNGRHVYETALGTWSTAGTVFGIYASADDAANDSRCMEYLTVDENGHARTTLGPGTYWACERIAATALTADATPIEFTISNDRNAAPVKLEFADEHVTVGFDIRKVNPNEALTSQIGGYSLAGAEFGVYRNEDDANNGTNEVLSVTTDETGNASVNGLHPGTYYVREKKAPANFIASDRVFSVTPGMSSRLTLEVSNVPAIAQLSVKKTSDVNLAEHANKTLAGAVFGVYSDPMCLFEATRLTTNASGDTPVANLRPGTYYVKEITAPAGYALDSETHEVSLASGGSEAIEIEDHLLRGTISADKSSNHEEWLDGDLSGARFGVFSDERLNTQVTSFTTDKAGHGTSEELPCGDYYVKEIIPLAGHVADSDIHQVTVVDGKDVAINDSVPIENMTSSLLLSKSASNGYNEMPLNDAIYGVYRTSACAQENRVAKICTKDDGTSDELKLLKPGTYYVREEVAPDGWRLDPDVHEVVLTEDSAPYALEVSEEPSSSSASVTIRKVNAETKASMTQGTVSCANATFKVEYYTRQAVDIGQLDGLAPERTWNVSTDDTGVAKLEDGYLGGDSSPLYKDADGHVIVPDGCLVIQETQAPTGMMLGVKGAASPDRQLVVVRDNAMFDSTGIGYSEAIDIYVEDDPMRGDMSFKKVDDKGSPMKNMPFVLSLLDSEGNTIETHLISTNENGTFNTAAFENPSRTNENDDLLIVHQPSADDDADDEAGTETLFDGDENVGDDIPLEDEVQEEVSRNITSGTYLEAPAIESYNHSAGVWFSGSNDLSSSPQEGSGSLLYGRYRLQEAHCEGNGQYIFPEPVEFEIDGDGVHVELGDMVNTASVVAWTSAHDRTTTTKFGTTQDTHIDDVVHYENLVPGVEYSLYGTIYDKDSAEVVMTEDWTTLGSSVTFTPSKPEGQLVMSYDTAGFDMAGKTVTIYLRLESNYKLKNEHNLELLDLEETIKFPHIETNALDAATKGHYGSIDEETHKVRITDTVSYENLEAGAQYYLQGTLHGSVPSDADGFTDEGAIRHAGETVIVEVPFIPEGTSGTQEVSFELDAADLPESGRVTVYETLYNSDKILVASHMDINDENQTIYYPKASTEASDVRLAGHVGTRSETDKTLASGITDVVTVTNLLYGDDVIIVGSLHDVDTGEPIVDANGDGIESRVIEHIDSAASDVNTIPVSFDAIPWKSVENRNVVVFEKIYDAGGRLLASHEDTNDLQQRVSYLSMFTNATDAVTGEHVGYADIAASDANVTVKDEISVGNLSEHMRTGSGDAIVTFRGTLYDADTGEKLVDGAGNAIESTTSATIAELLDGAKLVNSFTLDASMALGKKIVVVESAGMFGEHSDLNDMQQTVFYPSIDTEAGGHDVNANTDGDNGVLEDLRGSVPANRRGLLFDDVAYDKLPVGTYEIVGHFVDKETGEEIAGLEASKMVEIGEENSGMVGELRIDFPETDLFDHMGENVVAMEDVYLVNGSEKHLVARHVDVNDIDQTVYLSSATDPYDVPSTGLGGIAWTVLGGAALLIGASLAMGMWARKRKHGDGEE